MKGKGRLALFPELLQSFQSAAGGLGSLRLTPTGSSLTRAMPEMSDVPEGVGVWGNGDLTSER